MSTPRSSGFEIANIHTESMEEWTHRAAFRDAIARYKSANGGTTEDVAVLLGSTKGTLNAYLYRKDTKPSLEFLQRAAALMGVSVTMFIDDPTPNSPGVDLSTLDPLDRARFGRMVQAIGGGVLTEDDKDALFEDFMRDLQRRQATNAKNGMK